MNEFNQCWLFLLMLFSVMFWLTPDRTAFPAQWEVAIVKCEPFGGVREYVAHSTFTGVGDLTCTNGTVFSHWYTAPLKLEDE